MADVYIFEIFVENINNFYKYREKHNINNNHNSEKLTN